MNEIVETRAEEIARLQREIGERQFRLQYLVLGDPFQAVSVQTAGVAVRSYSLPLRSPP